MTPIEAFLEILRRYFRVKVKGLENVPREGPVIILPNHSGFAGADAVVLVYILNKFARRRAKLFAHRAYFEWSTWLRNISERFEMVEASLHDGIWHLKQGDCLVVFPEGENGNFKTSLKMYQLQEFHTGFVRMATATGAPVVPTLIVGAEESHLNLGKINLSKWIRGLKIPLPLNVIPLPAKWEIHFMEPVRFKASKSKDTEDFDVAAEAGELRRKMQSTLMGVLRKRGGIFF